MEKELYPIQGIITTVISPFIGEDKKLDIESLHNEIDMACKAGVAGFLVPCLASEQWLLSKEEKKLLVSEVKKALDHYLRYIKLQDASQADYLKNCLDNNFYLLALYRLAYYEKARNQNPNLFLTAWSYNCFIRTRENMYEGFGVGLICELEGNKELARDIFKSLHTDNPLSEDAINTLKDFYQRNPEMKS